MDYRIYNHRQLQTAIDHSRKHERQLVIHTVDERKTRKIIADSGFYMSMIGKQKFLLS